MCGKPFDQTLLSTVGAENIAYARAITFDLFGANQRNANQVNPAYATADALLPRWEAILNQPPQPGDTESVRAARCAAAIGRFGRTNSSQPIIDVLVATLGSLFVGLMLFTPANALVWWPGYGGAAAAVSSVAGNKVTVTGLTNVPTAAPGAYLTLSNCTHAGNDGTFPIQSRVSATSVWSSTMGRRAAPTTASAAPPVPPRSSGRCLTPKPRGSRRALTSTCSSTRPPSLDT